MELLRHRDRGAMKPRTELQLYRMTHRWMQRTSYCSVYSKYAARVYPGVLTTNWSGELCQEQVDMRKSWGVTSAYSQYDKLIHLIYQETPVES